MPKVPLYSRSTRRPRSALVRASPEPEQRIESPQAADADAPPPRRRFGVPARVKRFEKPFYLLLAALFVVGVVVGYARLHPPPRALTQDDIDEAVMHTVETKTLPSQSAKAYEIIRPSVVMVREFGELNKEGEDYVERGVGSGVVIIDNGTILTNLHVVAGAHRIKVTFFDGTESDATVISAQPENDLAVLRTKSIPDDLQAATLRSTSDLAIGDRVIAVGFPFGIGPSASEGIVSGLRREYHSPEGRQLLTNLIQFDAAANPGNSGGPLVTAEGEVVGIVTGILNPTSQRVFVGIGFAVPIENAAAAVGISPF